jgi:hypothetical protein
MKTIDWNYMVEKYFLLFVIWIGAFFAPINEYVLSIGLLIAADTMIGIYASVFKQHHDFSSRKFWNAPLKFLAMGMLLIVALVIEIRFLPTMPVIKIVGGLMALAELRSIDEKCKVIFGISIFNLIIEKLKR